MTGTTSVSRGFSNILSGLKLKFLLSAAIVLLADWLLLGHMPGIAMASFVIFLGAWCSFIHFQNIGGFRIIKGLTLLLLLQLPIIEDFSVLSLLISLCGAVFFLIYISGNHSAKIIANIWPMILSVSSAPFYMFREARLVLALNNRIRARFGRPNIFLLWILPILFTSVFVSLFMIANPLFKDLLTNFDSEVSFNFSWLKEDRVVFWLLMVLAIWPFISIRKHSNNAQTADQGMSWVSNVEDSSSLADLIFNKHTVLRSLVLFNLVFALQTSLDLTYLWAGFELPKGMNYADYAHRGAYPLVATALLAAAFVLVALRRDSETDKSLPIHFLVYLFVGQNIILVLSSILRLNLYVEIYYLTQLRVAAFIWMGLIASGLVLILARVFLKKDNSWLINSNLALLLAILYGYSLFNVNYYIADYNVTHVGKGNKKQARLDTRYLCELGIHAIPAIDKYLKRSGDVSAAKTDANWRFTSSSSYNHSGYTLQSCREEFLDDLKTRLSNWRSWNFSSWRLANYILPEKSANPVISDGPSLNKEQ